MRKVHIIERDNRTNHTFLAMKSRSTVKPVLRGHSKRRQKIGFQDRLSLNIGQKHCRMLLESILQYFSPSLSYHLSLRPLLYPPQTLFVGGILFSRCPCVCPSVRPSVTLCFLNNSKSHCWIFIKPCKHLYICKTNTLDKKVRARGQFY